jgi:heterodisulfide reductase subunit B
VNNTSKYALFLGCTIPARSRNYELSARKVAGKLGIEFIDLNDFVCCGFPVKSADIRTSMILGAYNLALAQKKGLDICTLCSSCTSALTEVEHHLLNDEDSLNDVNERLEKAGLEYAGRVKVRHFARILYEEIGTDRIRKSFQKELKGLRIAIHYGCHYLKPTDIYNHFDEPEAPESLDNLVAMTGAEVIDYRTKKNCCGGPVLPVDEKTSLSVAKEKLEDISNEGADAICLVCPFCSVMYDSNQKGIESEFNKKYSLPVIYLTQLLGVAMGFDRKELGLNMNVVKTKELFLKYYEKE